MTKPAFAWSKYQSRIIEYGAAFFDPGVPETPKEHVAVDACAGSGKSTVLEGLVVRVLQVDSSTRVASLAFNTKITNATRARLQKAGVVGVDVKGLHSLGKSALDYRWGRTTVNKDKGFVLAKRIVPEAFGYDARQCVLRLARLAMAHVVEDDAALQELMFDYDIAPVDAPPEHVVGWAQKYLAAMREKSAEIDFDQMIYVPAYFKMKTPFYHLVLVDEVQDMNNAQLIIAKGAMREGGHIVVVGDPNQCVPETERVITPAGSCFAKDLRVGDEVVAYVNGENRIRRVTTVAPTGELPCVKLTLVDGQTVTFSLNHRTWATPPALDRPGQSLVYLMYREDMGFRVGITNKGYDHRDNKYGNRMTSESADRLWVLDKCDNREDALTLELRYSLKYRIPTLVFNGIGRGLNQERINAIFAEFGRNGLQLLEDKRYHFDYPHWMQRGASSGPKQKKVRRLINVVAHSAKGSQVNVESNEPQLKGLAAVGHSVTERRGGGYRIRKFFARHDAAEAYAWKLAGDFQASILWRLSTNDEPLQLINAAALFPGMAVATRTATGVKLVEIVKTERVGSVPCLDIGVDDANNFYAGSGDGILSHNSIYRFRGAGVDSFNQVVRELDADVLPLSVSYRCPVNVVREAQKFVPSIEPSPYAKPGTVERLPDAAMLKQWKPGDFVLSRANAPLMKYCLTALAAGVPAYIEGKNVGKGLLGLIQKSGEFSLPGFVKWLGAWRDEQVAKAEAAEKPDAVEEICDRFDVMTGLVEAATSLDDLRQRIGVLFEGDDNDQQPIEERAAGRVMFSSVHRAKGAETDGTVWLLDWTFRPGKNREEDNLCYVAITRAKDRLVFVTESQFFEKTKKKEYEASE